ncbi:hypothetical protein B8X00_10535, partial [Acetobacter fabarum]
YIAVRVFFYPFPSAKAFLRSHLFCCNVTADHKRMALLNLSVLDGNDNACPQVGLIDWIFLACDL